MRERELEISWTPGRVLTLLGGFGLVGLGIALPLVGPAGRITEHAWPQNTLTFLAVWLSGCGISALAWWRCGREHRDQAPVPVLPARLLVFCYLFLLLLVWAERFKT